VDGETLQMLADNGSMDQLKSCGFIKVKDQLKLQKLLGGDYDSSSKGLQLTRSNNVTVSSNGKLTLAEMKKLTPEEKRLYLIKLVCSLSFCMQD